MALPLVAAFVLLFLSKYLRLFVNLAALALYKPIEPAEQTEPAELPADGSSSSSSSSGGTARTLSRADVSVIIAALDPTCASMRAFIPTAIAAGPHRIYIVTIDAHLPAARALYLSATGPAGGAAAGDGHLPERDRLVQVRSVPAPSKRGQLAAVLPEIGTELVVLADDDVLWPAGVLDWLVAPFAADGRIGGLQTRQSTIRPEDGDYGDYGDYGGGAGRAGSLWHFLNSAYLVRRNFDCTACVQVDYGLPCLSGRTAAYRARILQQPAFLAGFVGERWRGRRLNPDDDNFLTRWLVAHGWRTWIQDEARCEVRTRLEPNWTYYAQCVRWARSNWRSNWRSLATEATVWRAHPWSTFAVFQTTLTSWAPLYDGAVLALWWRLTGPGGPVGAGAGPAVPLLRGLMLVWVLWGCRAVKYVGHCRRYPGDIKFLVLLPLIAYVHAVTVKLWALLTLTETTWGSRAGADGGELGEAGKSSSSSEIAAQLPEFGHLVRQPKPGAMAVPGLSETPGSVGSPLVPRTPAEPTSRARSPVLLAGVEGKKDV